MADATAKFRLLGEDATAAAFAAALGNANKTANGIQRAFKVAFAGVSLYTVTRAITGTVGQAIELGDELDKAAVKAGMGGRAMSELAHVAKMADVELGALSSSLRKMQVAISEADAGGKSQIQTLRDLGLELGQIKNLQADKQFELLADKINDLRSEEDKARIVTELFGKSGADLLPMFEQGAEGIRKAREEAVLLGKSLSDEQVKGLAEAENSVKRLGETWTAFKTLIVADVAPELTETLAALNAAMVGGAAKTRHELQIAQENYARALAAGADADSLSRIDAKIREHRAALGMDNATGGRGPGPGALRPINVTHQRLGDDKTRSKAIEAEEKAADEAFKRREEALNRENDLNEHFADLSREVQEQIGKEAQQALDERLAANEQAADQRYEIELDLQRKIEALAEEQAAEIKGIFDEGIFIAFERGADGMLKYWADTLKKMAIQAAATQMFSAGGGGVGAFFSNLFGGFRAEGGPIEQGKWYIAGERGPEAIWGGGAGAMAMGYGKGGAQVVQHISIDARGAQQGVAQQLQSLLPVVIRQAVDQSRMAVRDDLSRGRMR
jgi:hypothetical protein